MLHLFEEKVLPYRAEQHEAWTAGDKSLVPPWHPVHDIVRNQPTYHFAEFLTLDHYHRTEGWRGFRFFVLGVPSDMGNERYAPGGEMIDRLISPDKLTAFRRARSTDPREFKFAKGEPDLFLYKDGGDAMFLEVKKGKDAPDAEQYQLRCLSQIRSILGIRAEIVYVVEEGKLYNPRRHEYDLPEVSAAARAPFVRRRG